MGEEVTISLTGTKGTMMLVLVEDIEEVEESRDKDLEIYDTHIWFWFTGASCV